MTAAVYPELLLFGWIVVVLFMDLFTAEDKRDGLVLTSTALFMFFLSIFTIFMPAGSIHNYVVRDWSIPLRVLFSASAFFSLLLARPAFKHGAGRERMQEGGVFVMLLLISTLGMFILSASNELITFFLGLEMATLPLYALSTWHRDKTGSEAGIKYLLIGALSTALLLFGCSFIYGATGSLHFTDIGMRLSSAMDTGLIHLGTLFILAALAFKLSAAPFHMWAPDVYAGAPTSITAFIASGSKVAGVLALLLLFYGPLAKLEQDNGLDQAFMLLAAVSMIVGNLGALKQTHFNRFMAYSSIAQVGFLFMALSGVFGSLAVATVVFYLVVYVFSNYLAFFVMHTLADKRSETLASLRGLSQQSPLLALAMMIAMFSLAGLPPFGGFIGKIPLFFAAAENDHYFLIFFGAVNAVVALYYYMIVVKEAYINKPEGELSDITISATQRWAILLLVILVITLGVCSQPHEWVFNFFSN